MSVCRYKSLRPLRLEPKCDGNGYEHIQQGVLLQSGMPYFNTPPLIPYSERFG